MGKYKYEKYGVIRDTELDFPYHPDYIVDLLEEKDTHIKKLKEENQQLKQQLHDLPKKIVEEVEKNFTEYLPLKYKTGAGFYLRLNAILKKFGEEDE